MKKIFYVLSIVLFLGANAQSGNGDALVGVWKPSDGRSMKKKKKIGDKFYGRVVWLLEPNDESGNPRTDTNNPDPELRSTPLKGYRLLKDFTYNENDKLWVNGTIYDPKNGSTYNCKIELKDENTIEVRGYIGTAVFGRTDVWTKMVQKKG